MRKILVIIAILGLCTFTCMSPVEVNAGFDGVELDDFDTV